MALQKEQKSTIMKDYGISAKDTGSAEVQVALLTSGIAELTQHCQAHPKDFSSRRGLLKMVCRRRRFLDYLMGNNVTIYKTLIQKLGIRK
jgi:small subunit ribosomal protein S15